MVAEKGHPRLKAARQMQKMRGCLNLVHAVPYNGLFSKQKFSYNPC